MKLKTILAITTAFLQSLSYSQTVDNLIEQARNKDEQMDTNGALALFLEAEKMAPENIEILIGLSKQYAESMVDAADDTAKRNAGETALSYAKKAFQISPEHSDANLAVAICYGRLLDLVSTKQKVEYSRLVKIHAEKAIALDPNSDYAWHLLGRWHRGVAEIDPLIKSIAKLVYGEIPKGSNEEAVSAFQKAIQINPNRLVHYIELGIALGTIGKKEDGRIAIEHGLAMPDRERDDPESKRRGQRALAEF